MDVCLNIFTKDDVSQSACPIKLFEYLVMRKPVISTPLEELKSIDDNFLYYASDTNELVGHISELLNGNPASQQVIDNGYSRVEQKYNWNFIAKLFATVIEETQKLLRDYEENLISLSARRGILNFSCDGIPVYAVWRG